jgi:hypothetical protein
MQPVLRVVRDRTKRDEDTFEIIQARDVVMIITVRESALASSPALQWRVTFEFGRGLVAITRMAETVAQAFQDAVTALEKADPRGRLPSFTGGEWGIIRKALDDECIFDP